METLNINGTFQFGAYSITLLNACHGSASILILENDTNHSAYLDFSNTVTFIDLGLQLDVKNNHLIIKRSIQLIALKSILPTGCLNHTNLAYS